MGEACEVPQIYEDVEKFSKAVRKLEVGKLVALTILGDIGDLRSAASEVLNGLSDDSERYVHEIKEAARLYMVRRNK